MEDDVKRYEPGNLYGEPVRRIKKRGRRLRPQWMVFMAALLFVLALVIALVCRTCTAEEEPPQDAQPSFAQSAVALTAGEALQLELQGLKTDASIVWSSSNTAVASVSGAGLVTGRRAGTASIAAVTEHGTASCTVTVTPREEEPQQGGAAITPVQGGTAQSASISFTERSLTVTQGSIITLALQVTPGDAQLEPIVWGSSNTGVATVADGVVTTGAVGITTITAKSGLLAATCTVVVKAAAATVTSVLLSQDAAELAVGGTLSLRFTLAPEDAVYESVSWSSSNETVASVLDGTVTARAEGSAVISCVVGGKRASCTLTVRGDGYQPGGALYPAP